MHIDYPAYHDKLQKLSAKLTRELRGPMSGFTQLRIAATTAGALDLKTKQLVALAIGVAVRCDGCIAYHVHDALQAGAGREEIRRPWAWPSSWVGGRPWSTVARRWRLWTSLMPVG